ncbi:MAG: hypothetical protein RL235_502, partial [Chlamydiota bacterium]
MDFLREARQQYQPPLPRQLERLDQVTLKATSESSPSPCASLFPLTAHQKTHELAQGAPRPSKARYRVGVLFSGGPAPGGHNVIAGLSDAGPVDVIGFLGGPSGLVDNQFRMLTKGDIDAVRNTGGFDLLGSGRTKIETEAQFEASIRTCLGHKLDALIIIGGDDSNTNAAFLAERFVKEKIDTVVVGVPKTIDGDLRSKDIEMSFGFDSACRTYAELIGNLGKDVCSSKKYYHVVKLMGRSASHITLECALQTRPNLAFIGEEGKGLHQIVDEI